MSHSGSRWCAISGARLSRSSTSSTSPRSACIPTTSSASPT
ncbi:hypothetical protein Ae331Ps2_6356 [Pseudonocardia sp. Ae331_Ps2]|nr:hypothetical protein Ae331Ps2_6356 [Pseudonocardia sp. Ae331_Ps2]